VTTEKLYWSSPTAVDFEARVVAVRGDRVVLDRTLFYPEGGGQLADRGTLRLGDRSLGVVDVQVDGAGAIEHVVEGIGAELRAEGAIVAGTIDRARRRDHMAQHTAQHVLSRALVEAIAAETLSARLGSEICTIDVDRPSISDSELARVDDLVNDLVMDDRVVRAHHPSERELAAMPLRRAPKVATGIRVIEVEGWDFTPCGGTHCARTGEIGAIRLLGTERYKGGTRLTFVAGKRALVDVRARDATFRDLARALGCGEGGLPAAIAKLRSDLKARTEAFAAARGELVTLLAAALHEAHPPRPGGTPIVVRREGDDLPALRALASALARRADVVACVAARDGDSGDWLVVVERGARAPFDAGRWFKETAASSSGRGGGRPDRAEGRLGAEVDLESCLGGRFE
jgi:alanyl-tRNA synthetase